MQADWSILSEDTQLTLSREALCRAALSCARHAELLAVEMDAGALTDRGGADALRLLAALMRATSRDPMEPAGSA